MDNTLNARIKLKYDTLANWNSSTFIPLAGEVCIAYLSTAGNIAGNSDTQQTNTPRAVCVKVGDGTHTFAQLPWIQAVAADVYDWAKTSTKPGYNASEIIATERNGTANASNVQAILTALQNSVATLTGGEGAQSIEGQIQAAIENLDGVITGTPGTSKTLTIFTQADGVVTATFSNIQIAESQVTSASGGWITDGLAAKQDNLVFNTTYNATSNKAATMSDISNAVAGLAGAMHFIGKSTIDLSTVANESANPVITGYDWNKKAPGDVVLNSTGNKEYVWNGTKWIELGDESSFALKTTTVTGTDGLTGGGAISNNQQISHAVPTGASAATLGSTTDSSGRKYIQTLTTDKFGHVTGATYASETVTNTTYTFAEGSTNGAFSVTPSGGSAQSVPIHGLKTIATSGSIYDIEEGSNITQSNNPDTSTKDRYLILDCGTAKILID